MALPAALPMTLPPVGADVTRLYFVVQERHPRNDKETAMLFRLFLTIGIVLSVYGIYSAHHREEWTGCVRHAAVVDIAGDCR